MCEVDLLEASRAYWIQWGGGWGVWDHQVAHGTNKINFFPRFVSSVRPNFLAKKRHPPQNFSPASGRAEKAVIVICTKFFYLFTALTLLRKAELKNILPDSSELDSQLDDFVPNQFSLFELKKTFVF